MCVIPNPGFDQYAASGFRVLVMENYPTIGDSGVQCPRSLSGGAMVDARA